MNANNDAKKVLIKFIVVNICVVISYFFNSAMIQSHIFVTCSVGSQ